MLEKPTRQDDMRGQTTESEDGQQHHDQAPDDDAFERAASSSPSSTAEDLPNRLQQPRGPAGYAHLAEFMTKTQHSMVRRYQELSLQNLLYLQAEIHMLKTDLDKETAADSRAPGECERSVWDYHWWSLATSPARGIGEGRRWDLWTRLRGRLGEYYDAIDRHNRVAGLAHPTEDQRKNLSEYIADDDLNGGRCGFMSAELKGAGPEAYNEKYLDDLIVFEAPGTEANGLVGRWLVRPILRGVHRVFQRAKRTIQQDLEAGLSPGEALDTTHPLRGAYIIPGKHSTVLNKAFGAVFLVLFPCAAIVSLNSVANQNKRVWMVCGFSVFFCIGMSVCSRVRRIEVFAVTAAFMSVQLVFVGGNGGGS